MNYSTLAYFLSISLSHIEFIFYSWSGITCDDNLVVTSINMEANQMTGPFPTDLNDLASLTELKIGHNTITDVVPDALCEEPSLSISGDAWNCPNQFDSTIGEYATGCCDHVFKDVETYLDYFALATYGDSVCGNLDDDTDKSVCTFMKDESKVSSDFDLTFVS